MRSRSETFGSLGRAPARTSRQAPNTPVTPSPPDPAPERGAIRRWLHGALFDNVGLKFLSIVLAITVFLLVNTDKDSEITTRIGVSYTLPDDHDRVLVSGRVEDVRVTIKGPWQRLRRFDQQKVDRINIDLRGESNGDIPLTRDMVHLPPGLTASQFEPSAIHVVFERQVDKVVEVVPQVDGRPQHGYQISEVTAEPATITVRGAEGALSALSAVHTREVSIEGRTENFVAETKAATPVGINVVGNSQVRLHVTVDEELVTRKLPALSVAVHGADIDPAKWQVAPAQVDITLTGTLLAVEKAKAALVPVVKLTAADSKAREAEVMIEGLPPGIGVKVSPERVKVSPVKPSAAP